MLAIAPINHKEMGYNNSVNNEALANGGAGNPKVWDIITSASHDLGGKTVAAFMNITDTNGAFSEMEENEYVKGHGETSTPVAAKYLNYTYPQNVIFEGRYTKLIPTTGTFKVWFLK